MFSWVADVEMSFPAIKREMEHVLETETIPSFEDISPDQIAITNDGRWKTFFFYAYGERVEENCAFCPQTDWALRKIPGMVTAFFSILEPGKVIPPHRGPYKGVLRYHLGLKVVPRQSGIRVGREGRYWEEGKSLIFDDTFMHNAVNKSAEQRVVLFVDFLRPLPFPLNLLNRAIVRYIRSTDFVQAGVRRLKELNK
jgi:beta-hydroxylase